MTRRSLVVIGGGISGLAAAWDLAGGADGPSADSPRVEVLEASERVGGSLATTVFAGRTVDVGPDGFLARRPEATALVRELGLSERLEAIEASGAWLWLRDQLCEIPSGLALGVPTSYASVASVRGLSYRARLAARRDQWLARRLVVGDDETIGRIVRAKLGAELAYRFVEPLVGGIQAGRIDDLSAKSVFPALLDAARRGGSLMAAMRSSGPATPGPSAGPVKGGPAFYSLLDGVGSLPTELAARLEARGVVIRNSTSATALRRGDGEYAWEVDTDATTTPAHAVIIATPAAVTAELVGHLDEGLAALATVPSAGAAMVTLQFARDEIALPEHGTGVLVPLATPWRGDTMLVTALTFLDRKWPHLRRDDDTVLRAHVGRSDDRRWAELEDPALIDRVADEVRHLLAGTGTPRDAMVQRFPAGLPQYRLGHDSLVASARAAAARLGFELAGAAYDGVGIPASIGSGRRAARAALERLR